MRHRLGITAVLFSFLFLLAAGCSSSAMRYIGYRLAPDKTPIKGDVAVPAPGLRESVTVNLDEYGVPHIQAKDEYSLFYALGYMHGRDRRFQMELLKMAAAGRMRELVGDHDGTGVMTRLEVFSRAIGLYRDADRMVESLDARDLTMLQAYSDGINTATANEPEPMEFRLLDYTPEPWSPRDCGLVMALVRFGLAKNWELELGRFEVYVHQLQTGASLDRAMQLWPYRYDMPPHLIGEKPPVDPFADYAPVAPELAEYLADYAKAHPLDIDAAPVEPHAATPPFLQGLSCSNNWAVDGEWTGTGKSAFSCDPHMPHYIPSLGYLAHLKCDSCEGGGYEIVGAGFTGLPAIPFGTNGHLAWGPTSNWADVTDVYVELPAPDQPEAYIYQGKPEPFTIREEEFRVRLADGSYRSETRRLRETRHGVVINDFVDRLPDDFPIVTLRRESDWGHPITALRNLYLAPDVRQGRQALFDFTAMIGHWVLADDAGDILYVGSVRIPKRTHHLGTVPVPGWVDVYEWTEFIGPEDLPWLIEPDTHYLGTANNQVVQPESVAYPLAMEGDVPHRVGRITKFLSAGNDGRPVVEQLGDVQMDGNDLGWSVVRPVYDPALRPLLKDADPRVAEAASLLLTWDGESSPESVEPALFQTLNALVVERVLADEVSPATLDYLLGFFNAEPFLFNIFANADNPAWDDRRTPAVETATDVLPDVFRDVVARLAERYGEDLCDWQWQTVAPFVLKHAFGDQGGIAGFVNRGPLPTAGTGNTVNKHQFQRTELTNFPVKYGPVLRIDVDFANFDSSIMSLPGGQSGRPASPHYDDLLPLYLEGRGIPMVLGFDRVDDLTVGRIELVPTK